MEGWWQQRCSSSLVSYSGILSMHYLKKRAGVFWRVLKHEALPWVRVVIEWLSSGTPLCSRWPQPSHMSGLPVPVVFWVSHNKDFKIQRRGRQRESRKNNRFYEQTTTLNKKTKFYLFLNMVMVPRNSTPGGFAYIRHSKRVMIAIKTERTQIHFKRRSRCRRVVGS